MGAAASASAAADKEREKLKWREVIMGSEWLPADPRIGDPYNPVTGAVQLTTLRQSHRIKQAIVDPAVAALEAQKGLKGAAAKKKLSHMITCINRVSQYMFVDSHFLVHCFNMLGGYLDVDDVDPGRIKLRGEMRQFVTCTALGREAIAQEERADMEIAKLQRGRNPQDLAQTEKDLIADWQAKRYAEPVPAREKDKVQKELGISSSSSGAAMAPWSACECGWCEKCAQGKDLRCEKCAKCAWCLAAGTVVAGTEQPAGVWHNGTNWLKGPNCDIDRAVKNNWQVYVAGLGQGKLKASDLNLGMLDLDIEQRSLGNLTKRSADSIRRKFGDGAKPVVAFLNSLPSAEKGKLNRLRSMDFPHILTIGAETVELSDRMCGFTDVPTSTKTVKVGWGGGLGGPPRAYWMIKEDIKIKASELTLLREVAACDVRAEQAALLSRWLPSSHASTVSCS